MGLCRPSCPLTHSGHPGPAPEPMALQLDAQGKCLDSSDSSQCPVATEDLTRRHSGAVWGPDCHQGHIMPPASQPQRSEVFLHPLSQTALSVLPQPLNVARGAQERARSCERPHFHLSKL